jgi:hypothetical protein
MMTDTHNNAKKYSTPAVRQFFKACLIALAIMLVSGLIYRDLYLKLDKQLSQPVKLPVPLSAFPIELGSWVGQDVPISETVQEVAGNDDFINRFYRNTDNQYGVSLYVAYSARPRYMQGHRPTACYVGGGWDHEGTDHKTLKTISQQEIACMIHRFHRIIPYDQTIYVLNFYLVNGQITLDEKRFSGIASRGPNLKADPARYVAQIQIMSQAEAAVLQAGQDIVDTIMRYFPDINGKIAAAGDAQPSSL